MDLAYIVTFALVCIWLLVLCYYQKRPKGFPPGPFGYPIVGNLLQLGKSPHEGICKFGEKYGKIFCLNFGSYQVVILNDADLIRKALKNEGFDGRPTFLPLMSIYPEGICFGDGWREQRKFAVHTLKDFGFGKNSMEGSIAEEVGQLIECLRALKGKAVCPEDLLSTAALNSVWSIVAGNKYDLSDPRLKEVQDVGHKMFQDSPIPGIYWLPWLVKAFPRLTGFAVCQEYAPKFFGMCWDIAVENIASFDPDSERHFVDAYWNKLMKTTDRKSSFYRAKGERSFTSSLGFLFVAGYDTLSATLAWAILYLGLNPEKCKKLQAEIESVIGSNLPEFADLLRMPYTEATMTEVFRLSSVAPNGIPHSTTHDLEFEGFRLPKDTIVLPNYYGVHHDPKIWGDPEVFRPERFLDQDGQFVKSSHVMPFGVGRRQCIAEKTAINEFFLYLTGLAQNFDFEFDTTTEVPLLTPEMGLIMHPKPYSVSFVPRN